MIYFYVNFKILYILTMHCNNQNQSLMMDTKYCEDISFFKEIIAIIDECSKLMKEDRIFLRNTIKDYMRELKQNKHFSEYKIDHIRMLVQIFVDADRKKSLSKMQKGDKLMNVLQTHLRKFIDNNKKQKHKKEIENFINWKDVNIKTSNEFYKENNKSSRSKQRTYPIHIGGIQINRNNDGHRRYPQLKLKQFSKSKQNSPATKDEQYSQCSYRKKLSFLKKQKPRDEFKPFKQIKQNELILKKHSQQTFKMEISAIPRYNDQRLKHSNSLNKQLMSSRSNNNCKIQKQSSCRSSQNKQFNKQKPHGIDSSKDFNKPIDKVPEQKNKKQPIESLLSINSSLQNSFNQTTRFSKNPLFSEQYSNRSNEVLNNSTSRYELSTKKIQQMFQKTSSIINQLENKNTNCSPMIYTNPINQSQRNSENIFTPPEFLAECRNYLLSSSKRNSMIISLQKTPQKEKDISRKLTFSSIINESEWDNTIKTQSFQQRKLQQAMSLRNSLNANIKKPSIQVYVQFPNRTIHNAEELLLQIFHDSHKVSLNQSQLEQIMTKSAIQCQKILQQYCDLLICQANNLGPNRTFDFIAMARYFYTYCTVFQNSKEYFSIFLNSVLDNKKKGFINSMDITQFFKRIESSKIQVQSLTLIRMNIQEAFMKCCQIQGEAVMTKWSLYYLQLRNDINLQAVKQLSSKIQIHGHQK